MMVPSSVGWGSAARYGLPGLVAGLALSWVLGTGRAPEARAQGSPGAEAHGTIAFTAATPGSASLLYLIDTRNQAFAVYRVDTVRGTVKLEAARQYRGDLRLTEFNNLPPEVAAVEAMVATTTPARAVKR
jgi:hypothetical protein